MTLFVHGEFTSHSGIKLADKIDCDALTTEDWAAMALWFKARLPAYGRVIGIPSGGIALAAQMRRHADHSSLIVLLVDDVLTTGRSMTEMKQVYPNAVGAVVFARTADVPEWIIPRFKETL